MPLQSKQAIDENTQGAFLSLQNVTKQFDQHLVLQDLNLDIRQGEFVAIIGKSGCGKSTLLRLLAGLDQSSAGNILVDYETLSKKQEDIRLMFQNSRLLPWKKVIDNIGLGLEGDWKQKALESLKSVGLEDKQTFWPASLSGGQQQRISLARALIHQPRLLLLDEPLGALDALTRIEMQQLIEKLWLEQGFTAIIVTHDVSEAVIMADRVILLEQGKIGLDLEINLPRPRRKGQKEVAELEGYLLDHILENQKINLM